MGVVTAHIVEEGTDVRVSFSGSIRVDPGLNSGFLGFPIVTPTVAVRSDSIQINVNRVFAGFYCWFCDNLDVVVGW